MDRRYLLFALPIILIPLIGFGIWRFTHGPASPGAPSGQEAFESDAYLPPDPEPESEEVRNLRELLEAITTFQEATTFRAKLSIDADGGRTTGQIDVMKPERFHGTVEISSEDQNGEVIGVGTDLYVKQEDGTWLKVQSPTLSASLTSAFRSAVETNIQSSLPDSTVVSKTRNYGRSCDEYRTTVTDKDGNTADLAVCVKDGLPMFIDARADSGSVNVEYFDYNKLFVIERPTIKR
ncbi:hypothetical protein KJ781_00310 [Patescibacteria group bacterium]|nr:hypothetical protein [Patescibacteria group bacterium]MBU1448717.1 hypothetical protein [Patescibacteria group bacterium]MBU2613058.1 hypothetical protein [Patescibacteria group bacterium]